jgi:hypothetical protein
MLPTVVCRCAPGVAVEYESPVTHDTHPIPLCSEINRRGCTREPSEPCDAQHHILVGFSVLHPRAQISETVRSMTALVYGFTPRSYPRCYKYKCKRK